MERFRARACQLHFLLVRHCLASACLPLSTDVHCRPAVERFTARVFKLPTSAFFPRHVALLSGLRALLAPHALRPHGHALAATAMAHLVERWPARGQARICPPKFTHHRMRDGSQNPGRPRLSVNLGPRIVQGGVLDFFRSLRLTKHQRLVDVRCARTRMRRRWLSEHTGRGDGPRRARCKHL